jgi:hypothetical protein
MQHSKKLDRLHDADLDAKPSAAMSENRGQVQQDMAIHHTAPGSADAPSAHPFMGCLTEVESRDARTFQECRARQEESHYSPI